MHHQGFLVGYSVTSANSFDQVNKLRTNIMRIHEDVDVVRKCEKKRRERREEKEKRG